KQRYTVPKLFMKSLPNSACFQVRKQVARASILLRTHNENKISFSAYPALFAFFYAVGANRYFGEPAQKLLYRYCRTEHQQYHSGHQSQRYPHAGNDGNPERLEI